MQGAATFGDNRLSRVVMIFMKLLHPQPHCKTPTNKLPVPGGALIRWSNEKKHEVILKYIAKGAARDVLEVVGFGFGIEDPTSKIPSGIQHG